MNTSNQSTLLLSEVKYEMTNISNAGDIKVDSNLSTNTFDIKSDHYICDVKLTSFGEYKKLLYRKNIPY